MRVSITFIYSCSCSCSKSQAELLKKNSYGAYLMKLLEQEQEQE